MVSTQMALGWNFPDATMQYSVPDLEAVTIDVAALQTRRDRLLGALRQWGYEITDPEGTFYLWGKAPGGDSLKFSEALAKRGVRIMPGTLFERPEHFRICLTATAEMIEAALPAFQELAPG
jgi:aspartate/methionine/tyrosine aminotransferase